MATRSAVSLSESPSLSCFLCQMFSYFSASFSDNGTCNKCSIFVALEARVSEYEARLPAVEKPADSRGPLASAGPPMTLRHRWLPVAVPQQSPRSRGLGLTGGHYVDSIVLDRSP
ncbi:hypothetical protein ATANTOWER_012645 [Ataeniobius toweri]|uniref:Uncharacterized protein n=1 Tax=Ataeniobius toweri TaxID=208326 RepID=A0ABU7C768_9TELE|nr:hypothetical protein [Ataeniobius toweri]